MARGPFQGTYRPGVRPTVVTAPDAIVYINGESDIIGCPQCRRKFDINKYITSIQVDLSVESSPGSASINLSVPRHTIDDLYFDGNILISPMMEIEIYAKGYYLVEGLPQYYPIFWGMTTEVNDAYSGGEHTVSINCADILKWWELCKMNINAAFTQPTGQMGRSIFGNVFFGMNPYDVIWTLAQQSFGDVVVGSGSLVSLFAEARQKQTFNAALSDIMVYWNQRFARMRSNLLLYGTAGTTVRGDVLYDQYVTRPSKARMGRAFASKAVRVANGGDDSSQMVYDPTDPAVVAFRTQGTQAGQINLWQSEYQTKLELANAAKEAIGFEFFMDVDGSIVFKPPFYNLDVLPNKPISWIQDIDVIDWDFSESEAEVVTQIQMQGNFTGNIDWGLGEETTPFTSVTDYHLLRKYGWRQQTMNSEFLGDTQMMFYVGMDMLDRYNSKRHRGSVSIPMRPELRLGFPIYVAPKDQVWYITGISHNIAFGGRAQTTLTLTAKRQKFIAPKGIGTLKITGIHTDTKDPKKDKPLTTLDAIDSTSLTARQLSSKVSFELKIGEAAQLPPSIPDQSELQSGDNPFEPLILRHPKTGRIVGYPNVVMAYTRPFNPPPDKLKKNAGQNPKVAKQVTKQVETLGKAGQKQAEEVDAATHTAQTSDKIREEQLSNRYVYGLNSAGVFTYCFDSNKNIQEVIFPAKSRITAIQSGSETEDKDFLGKKGSAMIRPVSDERGFEVVGHFRYGRGVYLRDGSLILNEFGRNSQASVDTQVALAGGLFETLSAQSQGISAVTGDFPNPAETIARLQPTDLQTAGRINPETTKPEFVGETEGVQLIASSAPLGSLEQKGLPPSVEASQLSRALTLAEMKIKEEKVPGDECLCLLGRSDLAFINVGYQVKTLSGLGSAKDASGLPSTSIGGTTTSFGVLSPELVEKREAARQAFTDVLTAQTDIEIAKKSAEVAEKLAVLEADPLVQMDPEQSASVARKRIFFERTQAVLSGEADADTLSEEERVAVEKVRATARGIAISAAKKSVEELVGSDVSAYLVETKELAFALSENRPASGAVIPSGTALQSRVEAFLVNLYSALDGPHQEFEKALRGELVPSSPLNPDDVRLGTGFPGQPQVGNFRPPFNAPNRALGGDPEALARSGKSSIGDLQKTWSEFGDKLGANTTRAKLEGEIKADQKKIDRLAVQRAELQRFLDQDAPGVRFPGNVQEQVDSIDRETARLEQQINKNQFELGKIPT